ncbi:hypothetical protein K6U31_14980 [Vibrio fluvialis]|nr:hypothetical protein [Vibrio fluvialis]
MYSRQDDNWTVDRLAP